MSYIGNTPDLNFYTVGTIDRFNGTGACTQFTLTKNISDPNAIEVLVNNVQQEPNSSFSVTNGVITFTEPPALSTNNIQVIYRVTSMVTYSQVYAGQLQPGSVTETTLATSSVTTSKISAGAITGNAIANNAVSGNNIVSPPDIFDDAFLFGGM